MVPSVLVLGLGNELLKDDGVGIIAVRRLREILDDSIECVESSESGLALMDFLVGHEKALIIDSVAMPPERAGEILELDVDDFGGEMFGASPHYVGLGEIRLIAQSLGLPFPKDVKVFGVSVKDPFTIGGKMSPEVEASIGEVVKRVETTILAWQKAPPPGVR